MSLSQDAYPGQGLRLKVAGQSGPKQKSLGQCLDFFKSFLSCPFVSSVVKSNSLSSFSTKALMLSCSNESKSHTLVTNFYIKYLNFEQVDLVDLA